MMGKAAGQLTSNWIIPQYAREALWVEGQGGAVQIEGEHGLFEMDAPSPMLTLRWYGAGGSALARLPWHSHNLEWDGSIRVGGYIDAMHITEIPGLNLAITVLYLGGQPLRPATLPFHTRSSRALLPYMSPEFHAGLAADVPQSVTTWLTPNDSPLATMAQEAMIQNLRLHFFGRLAEDESRWGEHFALPILLQSATLFAP